MQALSKAIHAHDGALEPQMEIQTQSLVTREVHARLQHEHLLSLGSLLSGSESMLEEETHRSIYTSIYPRGNTP